jgi:hypothetical protein
MGAMVVRVSAGVEGLAVLLLEPAGVMSYA